MANSGASLLPRTIAKDGCLGDVPDILAGQYDHLDKAVAW